MLVSFLQPENAELPIDVTEVCMFTLAKLRQFLNASLPIAVTEDGMFTLVKFWQLRNASMPIAVTEDGIEYAPIFPSGYLIMVVLFLSNNTPLILAYEGLRLSTVMFVKL
jgi:hypothetical protein